MTLETINTDTELIERTTDDANSHYIDHTAVLSFLVCLLTISSSIFSQVCLCGKGVHFKFYDSKRDSLNMTSMYSFLFDYNDCFVIIAALLLLMLKLVAEKAQLNLYHASLVHFTSVFLMIWSANYGVLHILLVLLLYVPARAMLWIGCIQIMRLLTRRLMLSHDDDNNSQCDKEKAAFASASLFWASYTGNIFGKHWPRDAVSDDILLIINLCFASIIVLVCHYNKAYLVYDDIINHYNNGMKSKDQHQSEKNDHVLISCRMLCFVTIALISPFLTSACSLPVFIKLVTTNFAHRLNNNLFSIGIVTIMTLQPLLLIAILLIVVTRSSLITSLYGHVTHQEQQQQQHDDVHDSESLSHTTSSRFACYALLFSTVPAFALGTSVFHEAYKNSVSSDTNIVTYLQLSYFCIMMIMSTICVAIFMPPVINFIMMTTDELSASLYDIIVLVILIVSRPVSHMMQYMLLNNQSLCNDHGCQSILVWNLMICISVISPSVLLCITCLHDTSIRQLTDGTTFVAQAVYTDLANNDCEDQQEDSSPQKDTTVNTEAVELSDEKNTKDEATEDVNMKLIPLSVEL
jgi:hypothetical protein